MSDPLASPAPCGPLSPRDGDEYREYFIPAFNASEEQKLLQDYAQDRLTHALRAILTDFYLLIELMRGYAQSREEADFTCFLLAEKSRQPLDRLSNACSATVDWKLVSRKPWAAKHKPAVRNCIKTSTSALPARGFCCLAGAGPRDFLSYQKECC